MSAYPNEKNHGRWWLYPSAGRPGCRLHAVPADDYDLERDIEREGQEPTTAACGRTAQFTYPGVVSRLVRPRCTRCCSALGIPAGDGTPCNEASPTLTAVTG
jgi:hypothetical protein